MKYIVSVREVHIQIVEVRAASPEKAIDLVYKGGGMPLDYLEYSHTLDQDTWTVEKIEEEDE